MVCEEQGLEGPETLGRDAQATAELRVRSGMSRDEAPKPSDPLDGARQDVHRAVEAAEARLRAIRDVPTSAEPPPLPEFGPIPEHPDRVEARRYGKLSQNDTREAIRLWSVAMNFLAGVIGGCVIGWLVDRWQGTNPYGVLIGCGIGLVAGFWGLMREVMREPKGAGRGASHGGKPSSGAK
jgi:ATP synthase protein I